MTLDRLISYARRTRLPRRGMRLGLCRSTARRMREKGRGACRLHVCRSTARRMRERKGVEPALLHACHVCLPSARLCVHVRRSFQIPRRIELFDKKTCFQNEQDTSREGESYLICWNRRNERSIFVGWVSWG
jgi:hypothetical protein